MSVAKKIRIKLYLGECDEKEFRYFSFFNNGFIPFPLAG